MSTSTPPSASSSRSASNAAQQSTSPSTPDREPSTSTTFSPTGAPSMLGQWPVQDSQTQDLTQILNKVAGTSYTSEPQPFRPQTSTPQPFHARSTGVSPTPPLSVKPSDVTSTASSSTTPVPSASASQYAGAKPAPVVAGMGTLPMNLASTSAAEPSGSNADSVRAIPTNKNNPAFLNKLRSMVDDTNTNELICWSPDGASFFVPNHTRFGDEVLPRFFKHSNFSSFVRQLNMYGFHKVPHLQQGALKHDLPQESELWEFSNPHFHRDHPEWLSKVQRKKGTKEDKDSSNKQSKPEDGTPATGQELMQLMRTNFGSAAGVEHGNEGALQLASVLNALNNIKNAQSNIITDIHQLQNSHRNLWQAELESRQRQKRTSDTVNKILRFLAGVFGNQEEDEAPVAGKKVPGKGRGGGNGRRVGVRPPRKGRLMIEDGKSNASVVRGLEELELPTDGSGDDMAEDMPSYMRFQEASSNSDSPKNGSSSPATGSNGSRFTTIGSPPNMSADFASLASDAPTTPGGSRRLSSHASNQVLNALASGEGNAWLASLFGASLAKQGSSKGTSAASGGGLKLDPQVVAALQQALVGSGGSEPDYLNSGSAAETSDFASRFSYPNHSSGSDSHGSNRGASSSQGLGHGLGLDADALARLAGISQALVQSPARQPFSSNNNNNAYFDGSPTKTNATLDGGDANSQQLALSLARSGRDLQNTAYDVNSVQNSINALIDGLQPNNAQQSTSNALPPQPDWQSHANGINAPASGPASLPYISGDHPPPPPSCSTADGVDAGQPSASAAGAGIDSDFDVDSFLSQFVDTSQAPGGGVTSPGGAFADSGLGLGLGEGEGESPSFAFSPNTTAAFLTDGGVNEPSSAVASDSEPTIKSIHSSTTNTPVPSSPTATPADRSHTWNMTLPKQPSKKRKPSSSSLDPVSASASPIPKHTTTATPTADSGTTQDVEMTSSRPPPPKKTVLSRK